MNLIHSGAAKTTVMTIDKPPVTPGENIARVAKQRPTQEVKDCSETAIYLEEIILNSDLDWF
ncbi:hypothetical protein [Porticoccus sp.]